MRNVLAVAAGCLLLTACGDGKDAGDLAGTWGLDRERTSELAFAPTKRQVEETRGRLDEVPPEMRAKMEAELPKDDDDLRKILAKRTENLTVELELLANGTSRLFIKAKMGMGLKEESQDGSWEAKGGEVVVTPKTRNGQPSSANETQRFVRKERWLVFLDPAGNELYWLQRKEQK